MFNSDITQTYNQQNATMEILIMLAGAFLLGALFSWLIKKFLSNDKSIQTNAPNYAEFQNLSNVSTVPQTNASRKVRVIDKPSESNYATPRIDDLTRISGIDLDIQKTLKGKGINSYTDLRDIERETLKDVLNSKKVKISNQKELETWPHQARLAAKGEWKKLSEYQAFIQRAQTASQNTDTSTSAVNDDLKIIEGIGPRIEEILNDKGIYTFKQLSKTDNEDLKNYIISDDDRFIKNETESWPIQAEMAENGQWDELIIYQEFMNDSTSVGNEELTTAVLSTIGDLELPEETHDNLNDTPFINTDPEKSTTSINEDEQNKFSSNQEANDDLKEIEGIGPKIEKILNKNGIYTFKQLRKSDQNTLKTFLDNAGSQFQIHETESWPHQAGMAERGEWDKLKRYRESMDNGSEVPWVSAPSKPQTTSLHVKTVTGNPSEKDDLKKIEGIGPKIEELLNNKSIHTYENLKDSNRNILKTILDDAGPQYRMHEPETWPLQARMAFNGEWKKLDEYQDFLMGRHR